jgi:hypothetical protein
MPAISANARFVAFRSSASNLVAEDTNAFADIFVRGPLFSPTVSTGQATVNGLSATLSGFVNPTGAPATAWIEYGPTTAYGLSTTPISTGAQNTAALFIQTASGLSPATTYHYRAAIDDGSGPVYGDDSYFVTGAPMWGAALRFDGASEVALTPVPSVSGQFTVECWARPADTNTPAAMIGTRSPYDASFDMKIMATGIHGDIGDGSNWLTTQADAPMTLSPGKWYHVAYVVSPVGYKIYVNGEERASGSFSGTPVFCDYLHVPVIGDFARNGSEKFRGDLDDVRVWNTARTAEEIQAGYDHPVPPHAAGLVYYHRFDSGAGSFSVDDGASGQLGSFSGNPVWVPSTVPLPAYAVPDAVAALRIASGLDAATLDAVRRYAADPAAPGVVDLPAALNILRAAVGTDANP